jgi:hydrogenase expression/formation protein HypC
MCLGIPGKVIEIYQRDGAHMGKADFDGIVKEICLEYLPEIEVGDYAIVHVGFAITRLDQESAMETLVLMKQMGMLKLELDPDAALAAEARMARDEDRR